jgi:hypothetical protein
LNFQNVPLIAPRSKRTGFRARQKRSWSLDGGGEAVRFSSAIVSGFSNPHINHTKPEL